MPNDTHGNGGSTLSALFTNLLQDMSLLVRKEMALARLETSQKISQAGSGATMLAIGAVLGLIGGIGLMTAAAVALALVLPAWAAWLIVGGAIAFVAMIFAMAGYSRIKPRHLKPERTMRTLREDAIFARQQIRGG